MAASKLISKNKGAPSYEKHAAPETCSPCQNENIVAQAETWCDACNDFLCRDCSKHHRKLAAVRHHRLIPVGDVKSRKGVERFAYECDSHKGKRLSYFCDDHEQLCCSKCFVTMHRSCSEIVCLADIATQETVEFKQMENSLCKLGKGFNVQQRMAKENKEFVIQKNVKANEQIDKVGAGLISVIERQMKDAKIKINILKSEELGKIQILAKAISDAESSLKDCKDAIESGKGDEVQLFVAMKHVQKVIKTLTLKLEETEKSKSVRMFDFIGSGTLVNDLVFDSVKVLGSLVATYLHNIEKRDDVSLKLYEMRRFKETSPNARWVPFLGKKDVTNVSTDKNTRLMYILLYSFENVRLEVVVDIQEGGEQLVHTTYSHKNATTSEVFPVKVVGRDGKHGLAMQAGHTHKYRISITVLSNVHPPSGYKRYCGRDKQGIVVSNGVTFKLFHYKVDQSDQIAGFVFSL